MTGRLPDAACPKRAATRDALDLEPPADRLLVVDDETDVPGPVRVLTAATHEGAELVADVDEGSSRRAAAEPNSNSRPKAASGGAPTSVSAALPARLLWIGIAVFGGGALFLMIGGFTIYAGCGERDE